MLRSDTGCRRVAWDIATGAHRQVAGAGAARGHLRHLRLRCRRRSGQFESECSSRGGSTGRTPFASRAAAGSSPPGRCPPGRGRSPSPQIWPSSRRRRARASSRSGSAPDTSLLLPDPPGDQARLSPRGVVFQDGENKRAARDGLSILKFIPRAALGRALDRSTRPLHTGSEIRSLAMDGPRVALGLVDSSAGARCDRVVYWNVAWPPAQRISAPLGPTCTPGARAVRIGAVAIGGFRAAWLAQGGGATDRLVVGSPLCQEWVVGRLTRGPGGDQLTGAAGDGATLAFAVTHHERELRGLTSVAVVNGHFRPRTIASGVGAPVSLSVDRGSIAILWSNGTVEIRVEAAISEQRFAGTRAGDCTRRLAARGPAFLAPRRLRRRVRRPDPDGRRPAPRRLVARRAVRHRSVRDRQVGRSRRPRHGPVGDRRTGARGSRRGADRGSWPGVRLPGRQGGIARLVPLAAVERALGRNAM